MASQERRETQEEQEIREIILTNTQREYLLDAVTVYKNALMGRNTETMLVGRNETEIKIILNGLHRQLRSPVGTTQKTVEVRPEDTDVYEQMISLLETEIHTSLGFSAFDTHVSDESVEKINEEIKELRNTILVTN